MSLHASRLNRCTSSILAPAKIVKRKQIVSKSLIFSVLAAAHNLKAVGSIPAPATNRIFNRLKRRFFCAQIAPFSLFSDTFINLVAG